VSVVQRKVVVFVRSLGTRIPHGTTRGQHVRLCGQFTSHTVRGVKKIEKKIVPFHPSFTPVHGRGPPSPNLIFFYQKNPEKKGHWG
jgi:hypothetical protein